VAARFQKRDRIARVGAQAIREHAPRRTCAHNDVSECTWRGHGNPFGSLRDYFDFRAIAMPVTLNFGRLRSTLLEQSHQN
jgi:hypothetical protein